MVDAITPLCYNIAFGIPIHISKVRKLFELKRRAEKIIQNNEKYREKFKHYMHKKSWRFIPFRIPHRDVKRAEKIRQICIFRETFACLLFIGYNV